MKISGFKYGRKLRNEIFFNKTRRKELKESFLKGQKAILENSDFSVKPVLKTEYANRQLEVSALTFTVTGLETIKKVEDFEKDTSLSNCNFSLFIKGKSAVIKTTFLKPLLDKETRITFVYFPNGLPKKTKRKAFIYKNDFGVEGYELIDSGIFKQKILNFKQFSLVFKGKHFAKNLVLTIIDADKSIYWAKF